MTERIKSHSRHTLVAKAVALSTGLEGQTLAQEWAAGRALSQKEAVAEAIVAS